MKNVIKRISVIGVLLGTALICSCGDIEDRSSETILKEEVVSMEQVVPKAKTEPESQVDPVVGASKKAEEFREEKILFSAEQLQLPGKKGICFTLRPPGHWKGESIEQNLPKVKALDVYWNYSWAPQYMNEQPSNIEFVPMIWGAFAKEKLIEKLKKIMPEVESGRMKRFLGFNEPDKSDQSNMPYEKVIDLWPELEKLGVPLCSPACANPEGVQDDSVQGVEGTWMRDFVKEADKRGYRLDYIGVHWYGGGSASNFKSKMKRIYEKYGKRPLLVTEFSPADWLAPSPSKNRHTPGKVLRFMKEVLPWMEEQDWIAGYAWYSFRMDEPQGTSSALFDEDGNLTACGRFYKSVTTENPQGDQDIKPDPRARDPISPEEKPRRLNWFYSLDASGDEKVSSAEWVAWHEQNCRQNGWNFYEEDAEAEFGGFDADMNGFLSSEEFAGFDADTDDFLTSEEFGEFDADMDDFLTSEEFGAGPLDEAVTPPVSEKAPATLNWFDELDENVDGTVTASEWAGWGKRNAEKSGRNFSKEKAMVFFIGFDANEDGVLSRKELLRTP